MGLLRGRAFAAATVHDILRNDRRRAVLRHMRETVGTVTVRELAEEIAELETGAAPAPRNVRESVHNSLHQTHLPKLDREGVVVYDRHRKTVSLEGRARELDVYMEVVTPYGVTWADYYRLLATVSLLGVLGAHWGVGGVDADVAMLVASAALAVVAVSTAYQFWRRRWFYVRTLLE